MNNQGDVRDQAVEVLNALLNEPTLAKGKTVNLTTGATLAAKRVAIEKTYSLSARNTGFVAIVDPNTGKLIRKVLLPGASTLAATANGAYALVDGSTLVFVDAAPARRKRF